jgi:hypothetical protein
MTQNIFRRLQRSSSSIKTLSCYPGLPWTTRSPDPNPIETLWAIIKLKVTKMGPRTIEVFKNIIIKAYKSNDKFVCEELAWSLKMGLQLFMKSMASYEMFLKLNCSF